MSQSFSTSSSSSSFLPMMQHSKSIVAGAAVGAASAVFATYFPFMLDLSPNRAASTQVYEAAFYEYDNQRSFFDNTFLTYGTDYGLAIAMLFSAYWIVTKTAAAAMARVTTATRGGATTTTATSTTTPTTAEAMAVQQALQASQELLELHIWRSRAMLLMYMLSVLAGGFAHQYFITLESRNTWTFRLLWTVCVGSVTAASGFMGSIGTAWAQYDQQWQTSGGYQFPVLSVPFWTMYACTVTAVVVAGGWSYQRPAADIFVAGITQFPSTFYLMTMVWYGLPTLASLSVSWRLVGLIVFIANAPLLPLYPVLVYYFGHLSLGQVNAILHTNLFLAWTGQGRFLQQVATAWREACIPPPRAVPAILSKFGNSKKLR